MIIIIIIIIIIFIIIIILIPVPGRQSLALQDLLQAWSNNNNNDDDDDDNKRIMKKNHYNTIRNKISNNDKIRKKHKVDKNNVDENRKRGIRQGTVIRIR